MGSHVVHYEVTGKDGAKLQKFYSDIFGWKVDTNNPGGYGMVRDGDKGLTGGIGAAPQGMPGGVTFYVHTDDPKGTLAKIEKLGGRVLMPLTEVAPETTIALFADPEGHVVGLM
ncbi:MAG TPA: VOC family protein [Candidatus Dormibacteraeota bacterium]|nr:VOC family protein [Candidatus Dormibacteraeota bacterium]